MPRKSQFTDVYSLARLLRTWPDAEASQAQRRCHFG
jgi:hypothetical protein